VPFRKGEKIEMSLSGLQMAGKMPQRAGAKYIAVEHNVSRAIPAKQGAELREMTEGGGFE
jgi:hypothetical protein